jgi:hypothetical protein
MVIVYIAMVIVYSEPNLVNQCYLANLTDGLYSADIFFLTKDIQVFLLLDMASRKINGYIFMDQPILCVHIIQCLREMMDNRGIEHSFIVHTDNQTIFRDQRTCFICPKQPNTSKQTRKMQLW